MIACLKTCLKGSVATSGRPEEFVSATLCRKWYEMGMGGYKKDLAIGRSQVSSLIVEMIDESRNSEKGGEELV